MTGWGGKNRHDMKKNEVNNWFNSLTVAEASRALSASLHGSGLSNRGILLISHDNYEELRSEHMGECREISLLRLWERLSDDDKAAVQRVYLDAASHPLAPNGKPSNLSPEDWERVRTPEFKAWFGDWENDPENASKVLDENGEPLVVWHGSNRDFNEFDLSRGGDTTGLSEWVDKKCGAVIKNDAAKGAYFSSYEPQAVSYAFLGRFYEYEKIRSAYEGLYPCVNSSMNYAFRNRQDFLDALRVVAPLSPMAAELLEKAEANPEKLIMNGILSPMPVQERNALSEEIKSGMLRYRELCHSMDKGQMSNEHNNYVSQDTFIKSFKADLIRLRFNDNTVRNEFGTFETHSFGILAGGNDELSFFFDDNKRCVVYDSLQKGSSVFLDRCSFNELVGILDRIDDFHRRFAERLDFDIVSNGYNKSATIYKAFLNIRNPLSHDYEQSAFPDVYKKTKWPTGYVAARQVDKALRDGNDGVVYMNIRDPFKADTYGVFSAQQVMIVGKKHDLRVGEQASTARAETRTEKRSRLLQESHDDESRAVNKLNASNATNKIKQHTH